MFNSTFIHIKSSSFSRALPSRHSLLKSRVLPILLFIVALQLIAGFFTYEHTLGFDEAMWQYIGRTWFRNGLVPYSGGVDNKSPLIFAVFGFSDKLFGVNYWFPRLLGIGFQSLGLYYVYKIVRYISTQQGALMALTIYGFSLVWHGTGGKYVSFTESYCVAFIIMAVYYSISGHRNKSFFISGALAGLAFMFNIFAFFGIFSIFIYLVLSKKSMTLSFLSGLLASLVMIAGLLSLAGIHIQDIFLYALYDNFGAGSVTDHPLSWELNNFFNHFFYSEMVLLLPGFIGYFFINKRNDIFLIWLACEFIGLGVIGTFTPQHFKHLLPALSIMNALCLSFLIENYGIPWKPIVIILWICFIPKLLEPIFSLKNQMGAKKAVADYNAPDNQESDYAKKMLGLWIKSNTAANDRVLVAGYGAIAQAYSERQSPTIYFNVTQTQLAKKIFFNDLQLHQPEMICVPTFAGYQLNVDADIRDFISRLTARQYEMKNRVPGYEIYLKNKD